MAINYSIWNQEDAGEDVKLADVQATDGGVGLKMFDDAGYVWEFDGVCRRWHLFGVWVGRVRTWCGRRRYENLCLQCVPEGKAGSRQNR